MLSAKQNFLETVKPDGKPDRLVKRLRAVLFCPATRSRPMSAESGTWVCRRKRPVGHHYNLAPGRRRCYAARH
jgi:hypothetical protein